MVVRDVEADCTVVGIPGRVIHQSGVRINPLAHSALPHAEANVIRNLMERIDELESTVNNLQRCLRSTAGIGIDAVVNPRTSKIGRSWNFWGRTPGEPLAAALALARLRCPQASRTSPHLPLWIAEGLGC